MLAAVLLAACTAGPGAGPPQRPGPSVAPQVSGPPLHVTAMTYNILGGPVPDDWFPLIPREELVPMVRAPGMVAKVQAVDPDIVGLQEFATGSESADWIQQHLPADTWVHGPDTHALMVRTSRFDVVATGERQLNAAGREGAIDNRYADWARLRDRSSGRTLLVLNVHAHAWQSETLAHVRSLAIGRLVALVGELDPGLKEPLVLLGDLNARSNDKRPLWGDHLRKLAAAGLVDTAKVAAHDSSDVVGANSLNRMVARVAGQDVAKVVQRTGSHIDYVWVPKGTRVSTWEVLSGPEVGWRHVSGVKVPVWTGIIPSDHSPVAAELRFD